ncbi:MAG TPA: ABC transporter permease, partial [Vicinamibacterales bacterium]|nr:ABC transporter permease [Vicinamibacterales bacterium]
MWPDFKYAVRTLQRSPRNTAIAAAILALAIGINTAMFSGINHVLLRPLPFPDADRLVRLRDEITDANGLRHPFNMSSRSFTIASNAADAFDEVVAMSGENMTLVAQSGGELPERVSVVRQSAGVDRVLGVHPAMGRTFSAAEEAEGEHSGVALVSHSLWQTRLGGTDAVLGSRIQLDDRAFTVVGVMPPAYAFPYHAQVWIPFTVDPADQSRDFAVWAHLKPGVTERQMGESLDRTAARVRQAQTTGGTYRIEVMTLRDNLIGSQDAPLRALSAIVAFLLLIACVNVATLLLASAVSRRREFAIRAALGASRARQIRQVFFETLLLAAMGCLAGVLLAAWIAPLTARLMPAVFVEELGLVQPHTDWRVAAFAAAAGVFSALLAALLPAFGASLTEPQSAILEQTRSATMGRSGRRLLGALVIAEGAFTVVLLAGAGLVVNNFVRLQAEPLGFDAKRLLTAELVPPEARYAAGPPRAQLLPAILERVRAEPGVGRAAATTVNPLGGGTWGAPVITEEAEARDPGAAVNVNHRLITPGLFATMGIPLLRGRDFTPQDRRGSPMVVIVSERMAHRLWPNQDPIGRRIRIARAGQPWLTVVGVAGDVADSHFPEVPKETWYVPYDQHAQT